MPKTPQVTDPTPAGFNKAVDAALAGSQQFANAIEPTAVHTMRLPKSEYERAKDAAWHKRTSLNQFTRDAVKAATDATLAEVTQQQSEQRAAAKQKQKGDL